MVGERHDGQRRHVGYLPTVMHPLIWMGQCIIVAADNTWGAATSVVSMAATDLYNGLALSALILDFETDTHHLVSIVASIKVRLLFSVPILP